MRLILIPLFLVSIQLIAFGAKDTSTSISNRSLPNSLPISKGSSSVIRTQAYLDQKNIHAIYSEGDFDSVVFLIEKFTKLNSTYAKSDSVFIAKHLAVIYTANPATRERGKHYMFKLLALLPSAKIVDMFVSDEIDHIFEKVREEYIVRQEALGKSSPSNFESNQYAAGKMSISNGPNPDAHPVPVAESNRKSSQTVYWVIGGTAIVAAAGAVAYFLLPSDSKDKEYDITPH